MKKILLLTIASMIFTSCSSPQLTNLQNSIPIISKVSLNENGSTFEKTEVSGIKFKKADPDKPLDASTTISSGANATISVNTNSAGYARIDAKTGKVLSMNRIIKYTQQNYSYPCPNGFCGDVPVPLAVQAQ